MAEFPALPLFTDAYLADTRHLTAAQHGAYLLLLITAWRTADCSLPDDDALLSRWACMDLRTWQRNKPVVMQYWTMSDDQRWHQRRLTDERNYVADVRSKKSAAGRASALKRNNRHSTPVQQNANRSAAPTPIPTPTEGKPSVVTPQAYPPKFDEFWSSWPKHRRCEKPNAYRSWKEACLKSTPDDLFASLTKYLKTAEVIDGYAPYPAKWLKQERWNEEHTPKGDDHDSTRGPAKSKFQLAVEATERARAERERGRSVPT